MASRTVVAVALTLAAGLAQAAAGRVLIQGPDVTATQDAEAACGDPVGVFVESGSPDLFEGGSPELQALVDAVHAVLAFECPRIEEIRLTGGLRGLPEPVYRGTARRSDDWLVHAEETISADAPPPDEAGPPPGGTGSPDRESEGYTLIGVHAGMSVDEARAAIAEALGSSPGYDAAEGVMTLQPDACDPPGPDGRGARPAVGSRCLTAWFTDRRTPRLYMVELRQVVEDRGIDAVEQALTERFGEPSRRSWEAVDRTAAQAGSELLHLGWGRSLDTAASASGAAPFRHELEAFVEPGEGTVLTTVVLTDPELAARDGSAAPEGSVDLKL